MARHTAGRSGGGVAKLTAAIERLSGVERARTQVREVALPGTLHNMVSLERF